jgi:PmbA protein
VTDEALSLADNAVELALAAGASDAEATCTIADRFSAQARDREIEKLQRATSRFLSLRIFVDGARATLATSDFTPDGLRAFAAEAVAAARHVAPDALSGLPDRIEPAGNEDLGIFRADVEQRDPEDKLDDALVLERTARAFDPRIVNSGGSRVSDASVVHALANSRGFRGSYRSTSCSRSASPIAADGTRKRVSSYGSAARSYADLEAPESIARTAARRAVESIGARKPDSMRCSVIFERDVAAAVLSDLFHSLSAKNVAMGNSFLIEKVGTRVGSDLVTIWDDGRLHGGLGTSPFDAEGIPTQRTLVFERGTLRSYLYDTYYGRKLGARSTANSDGAGIGPNNFYLEPGTRTLDELIAATPRGVLVLDTIGFATEYVSGTYSRGARGFLIEGGELVAPLDEFTIAGNLGTMLEGIDAVASDLRFDSAIAAPSFRVAEMTVSGN